MEPRVNDEDPLRPGATRRWGRWAIPATALGVLTAIALVGRHREDARPERPLDVGFPQDSSKRPALALVADQGDQEENRPPGKPFGASGDDETIDALLALLKPIPESSSPEVKRHAEAARKAFEAAPRIREAHREFARQHPKPTRAERREFFQTVKKMPAFRRLAERFYTGGVSASHLAVLSGGRGPAAQRAAFNALGLPVGVTRIPGFKESAAGWLRYAKERVSGLSPNSSVNLVSSGGFQAMTGAGAASGADAASGAGAAPGAGGAPGAAPGSGSPKKVNLGGASGVGGQAAGSGGPAGKSLAQSPGTGQDRPDQTSLKAHDVDRELREKLEAAERQIAGRLRAAAGTADDQLIDGRIIGLLKLYPWLENLGMDKLREAVRLTGAGDLILNYGAWGACFALPDAGGGRLYDKCYEACLGGKGAQQSGAKSCQIELPNQDQAWEYCLDYARNDDRQCLKLCNDVRVGQCKPGANLDGVDVVTKYCDPAWNWVPPVFSGDTAVQIVGGYWEKGKPSAPSAECTTSQKSRFTNAAGDAKAGELRTVAPKKDPASNPGPAGTPVPEPLPVVTGNSTDTGKVTGTAAPADTAPQPTASLSKETIDSMVRISGCDSSQRTAFEKVICYTNFSYNQRDDRDAVQLGAAAYFQAATQAMIAYRDASNSVAQSAYLDLARDLYERLKLVPESPYAYAAEFGAGEAARLDARPPPTTHKTWGSWWPDNDPFLECSKCP